MKVKPISPKRKFQPCFLYHCSHKTAAFVVGEKIMKRITIAGCAILLAMAGTVFADDSDALMQLDKEWGTAGGAGPLKAILSDKLLSVSPEGIEGKAEMIAAAESDTAPAGPYVAGDYQIRFLSDDIAVMAHSAGGDNAHWSMHVFQKMNGKWQVAATASIPAAE